MTSPIRVLVADDERHVRELLRDFLAAQGYDVATVSTGDEALAALPLFAPDVILADMVMPGVSGQDLATAVCCSADPVPVILVTGTPTDVGAGFFQVLQKPFKLEALAEVVAAAARTRRAP